MLVHARILRPSQTRMFVNQIAGSQLLLSDGGVADQIDNPDWDTIERAIRALGTGSLALELRHITTTSGSVTESYMGISGGVKNSYVAFVWNVTGIVHLLKRGSHFASDGLEIDVDLQEPLTLEVVLRAARAYAVSGTLDGGIWKKIVQCSTPDS